MTGIDHVFIRGDQELRTTAEPLELRYDSDQDLFQALPVGESTAGRSDEKRLFMYFGSLRYCLRTPEGPISGFQIVGFMSFEPEEFADATFGPTFDALQLGLEDAFVGDIIYAAQEAVRAGNTGPLL